MKKGFTLIEVLVVAVIVAILAAVAIPSYQTYIDNAARDVAKNMAATVASEVAAKIAADGEISATEFAALKSYTTAVANPQIVSVSGVSGSGVTAGTITVDPARAGVSNQTCEF